MIDTPYAIGWLVLLLIGGAYEAWALYRPKRGDTLSESTWWVLRKSVALRFVAAGFLTWLLVHFVFLGRFG